MFTLLLVRLFVGSGNVHRFGSRIEQHDGPARTSRCHTPKKTMRYMAFSLALTAGGLVLAYLLLDIPHSQSPTMNDILTPIVARRKLA